MGEEIGGPLVRHQLRSGRARVNAIRGIGRVGRVARGRLPKIAEVAIEGLPESLRPAAEEVIARCAERYLASTPVYRLKQGDFKQSLAKMILKSVRTRNGGLEIVIGAP